MLETDINGRNGFHPPHNGVHTESRYKIGVVDSNRSWIRKTDIILGRKGVGHTIVAATDGFSALDLIETDNPDLFILGDPLLGIDTKDVISRVRESSPMPIIVMGDNKDPEYIAGMIEGGVNGGADEYGVKEYISDKGLAARVEAVMRRVKWDNQPRMPVVFTNGELTIDFDQHGVKLHDRDIPFTPTEYELLACLAENLGHVVPHNDLLLRIVGVVSEGDDRHLLRAHFARLRSILGENPNNPHFIETRKDVGYLMREVDSIADRKEWGDTIELLIGPIDKVENEDGVYPYPIPRAKLSEEIAPDGFRSKVSRRTIELINAIRFLPEGNAVVGNSLFAALRVPDYYIDNAKAFLRRLGSDYTIVNASLHNKPALYYWKKIE